MEIKLFDVNCMIGNRISDKETNYISSEFLLNMMDKKGIDKALLYHSLAKENLIYEGNKAVVSETYGSDRLIPCWVVMPHYSGECQNPDDIIQTMIQSKVKAVRIFPEYHKVKLFIWLWKELFCELEKYRVPVLIDYSNVNWSQETDWDEVHNICSCFPNMPVILLRQGQLADRYLYFLMKIHQNLYLETSYYQINNGILSIVKEFGAERLIFGTGMPYYQPDCPINALLYSGLSENDIQKIASENIENLLKGVCLNG